jgi:CheY-like chemotaxis protein
VASVLAIGAEEAPAAAVARALDRAVHGAGADWAGVLLREGGGLRAAGWHGAAGSPEAAAAPGGLAERAVSEGLALAAAATDAVPDPLLRETGVHHVLALPLAAPGGPVRGVLLAGRRRAARFGPGTVGALALVAAGLATALAAPPAALPARSPDESPGGDVEAAAGALAREARTRLGAEATAVLLPRGDGFRVAGAAWRSAPAGAPAGAEIRGPLLDAVRASRRPWTGGPGAPEDPGLAAVLGVPPRLAAPVLAGSALVGVLLAGGPAPLGEEGLRGGWLAGHAAALRSARLHAEGPGELPGRPGAERPGPPAAPPAQDLPGLLAVVVGRLAALRERVEDTAVRAELEVTEEAAWQAAESVRDLLGLAPGRMAGVLAPLDLGEVLRRAAEDARRRWAAAGPAPALDVDIEPLPPVHGSAEDLRDAVGRLLDSAAEAAGPGRRVALRAHRDGGGQAEIAVEDGGAGLDDATRARTLDAFFTTRGAGRLGLGLAVAQAVAARHHGALELASTRGLGTVVRLRLPLAGRAGAGEPAEEAPPRRVLLVEDEGAVREALAESLRQLGHAAVVAGDWPEALRRLEEEAIDAVVTDLALPGGSGLEVARAVKRLRPRTPVILVTGWPGGLDAASLDAAGVDAVIDKPVGVEELAGALLRATERRADSRPV